MKSLVGVLSLLFLYMPRAHSEEPDPGYEYALKHWGTEVAERHKVKKAAGTLTYEIGCLQFQRVVGTTRAIAGGDMKWAENVPSCMRVPNIFKPHIVTTLKDSGMTYYQVRLFIGEQSYLLCSIKSVTPLLEIAVLGDFTKTETGA